MIQQKSEIKAGLESSFQKMVQFIESLDKHGFEDNPNGKWSAGQQLEHLIKSVKPLNQVFLLPKFIFPMIFGKMKRTGRTYEELLDKYHEKLKKGGQASSPFVPVVIKFEERTQKLTQFKNHLSKLIRHLDSMSDRQLDTLILPHPLLGKVSLREMMFFTIFHTEHHLNLLQAK
jgi:hypothetical protein